MIFFTFWLFSISCLTFHLKVLQCLWIHTFLYKMKTVYKNKQAQMLKNCKVLIKNKMKSTSRLSPRHVHEMFNLTSSHQILFQLSIPFAGILNLCCILLIFIRCIHILHQQVEFAALWHVCILCWVSLWSRVYGLYVLCFESSYDIASMACMYSVLNLVVISLLWPVCTLFWVQLWSHFYGLYVLCFESSYDLASMACMYSVLNLVVISLLWPVCTLFWVQLWSRLYGLYVLCFESSCDLASMACMYPVLSPVVISLKNDLWIICFGEILKKWLLGKKFFHSYKKKCVL